MKKLASVSKFCVFALAFFVLLSDRASAYIDPSAVNYVVQAVAAVVIAAGALLTVFRHKIASFFKKDKNEEKKEIHLKEDLEETEE